MSPPAGDEPAGRPRKRTPWVLVVEFRQAMQSPLRAQTMSREMIDFSKGFLLQHASEWSAEHRPFDEPRNDRKMIDFSKGFLL